MDRFHKAGDCNYLSQNVPLPVTRFSKRNKRKILYCQCLLGYTTCSWSATKPLRTINLKFLMGLFVFYCTALVYPPTLKLPRTLVQICRYIYMYIISVCIDWCNSTNIPINDDAKGRNSFIHVRSKHH